LLWENRGINIDGEKLTHLRFADDIVLVTVESSRGEAKQILEDIESGTKNKLARRDTAYSRFE